MDYKNLTPESAAAYIKNETDLFPEDADLDVYEIGSGGNNANDGDGFINFVFRITDTKTHHSVILKQARDYARTFKGDTPFIPERNATEAKLMAIKSAITPDYIPEIYRVDETNHLYICEDCGNLKIWRFALDAGKIYPKIPKMVGELVAKNNFYTSELYLEPEVHQKLEATFNNATMRNLFENILFLHIITTPEEKDPVRLEMANVIWQDHAFRTEMLKLRHIYMAKSECLIHSDLHTSNIMVDADHMKTIDMEYAFMGPCSADSGYLIGNFLYQYLRWFYCPATEDSTPEEMRAYALDCIRDFLNTYFDVFKACWAKDVRKIYQGFDDYRDYLLDRYFHETVGFIGCQIMSRIGRDTATPDIDTIPDKNDQYEACRILLLIAQYLVLHRKEITDTDDLIKTVVELTETSRKALH
jgi:5-methylthioribose kinase